MLFQKLMEFFHTWEVRIGVILSMFIQIILVCFGSQRKISAAVWLKILTWCAYMSADAVAIFSLGVLAQRAESCKEELQSHQLHLLWVPFLILHLGGPDTITAYSLEDNKLWLRHLLNLVIQVGVAFYVIIKSWSNHNPLTYLVIPIFVSGVIKYCERIWALKSASMEHVADHFILQGRQARRTDSNEVFKFLSTLLPFFANKSIPREKSFFHQGNTLLHKSSLEAFRLVESELGLVYDFTYTKAWLICSGWGVCVRCVYLVSSVATLTFFVIMHIHKRKWFNYPLSDVLITYFLMLGAVIVEKYTDIWIVLLDWTLVCLDRCQRDLERGGWASLAKLLFPKSNTGVRALLVKKRWSRKMKQCNILRALASSQNIGKIRTLVVFLFHTSLNWEKFRPCLGKGTDAIFDTQTEYGSEGEACKKETSGFENRFSGDDDVNETKERIFKVIVEKINIYKHQRVDDNADRIHLFDIPSRAIGMDKFSEFLYQSVDEVVKRYGNYLEHIGWSTNKTEFDRNLLMWHVATTLCYYSDESKGALGGNADRKVRSYCNASRYISDYMMYLACFGQKMLPAGNYDKFFGRAFLFSQRYVGKSSGVRECCEKLLQAARGPGFGTSEFSKYEAALYGAKLVVVLEDNQQLEQKWEMIREVWVHLLLYAAGAETRWEEHAQQLRRGGEFITHVAALLAFASLSLRETRWEELRMLVMEESESERCAVADVESDGVEMNP